METACCTAAAVRRWFPERPFCSEAFQPVPWALDFVFRLTGCQERGRGGSISR